MTSLQEIKNRYGIIGNHPLLIRAIDIAVKVASTDLTVLILGESGTGKEVFPQIIHQFSSRKHGPYIAVNCGAIPEGTIDSELFGHEKGAFTGATDSRKGYFEVANGGTIFLDEVGELPLPTQARLLRILETGEYIRVGSSKVQKTNVRVVAATNINFDIAIQKGKFREDLYYRLNTVPIYLPPLRERKEDIILLFKKFASDFAVKYKMPAIQLTPEAEQIFLNYYWPGNIRQLKNITEQISIIEKERNITPEILSNYLKPYSAESTSMPIKLQDIQYEESVMKSALFELKKEVDQLKKIVYNLVTIVKPDIIHSPQDNNPGLPVLSPISEQQHTQDIVITPSFKNTSSNQEKPIIPIEETLSLQDKEKELIKKALIKHKGKRKYAAKELGISERTLYRKINEYNLKDL
ncbi:MAG: sigma-54-dependent Fis family transcriptional regulator [Bacteroidia bacterium]|nr:MAG: sigma-54-dependent Fis family transcriptional regulator [Bacteroidia bacterium]